jgi:ribonuclease J
MDERGYPEDTITVTDPWPHKVAAGPFSVSFLPISHSVPKARRW